MWSSKLSPEIGTRIVKVEAHLALRQYFKQKTPLIIKAFLNIIENYDLIRIQSPAEDE